jgi:hypothetical protein
MRTTRIMHNQDVEKVLTSKVHASDVFKDCSPKIDFLMVYCKEEDRRLGYFMLLWTPEMFHTPSVDQACNGSPMIKHFGAITIYPQEIRSRYST